MPFRFKELEIPGIILIEPEVFHDDRGFFLETYHEKSFSQFGITDRFVQENHSKSNKGTLRGLHYQIDPFAQGKLVRVIRGEIFDVAVDIRNDSPYFGRWLAETLSEENKRIIYIPPGFAHGFCVLSVTAEVVYMSTNVYSPQHERGIIWNDPDLGIEWPFEDPVLSLKDRRLPRFNYTTK